MATEPTKEDINKVKELRDYYARKYDLKTDIEFMEWIKKSMELIRAEQLPRIKAIFEKHKK